MARGEKCRFLLNADSGCYLSVVFILQKCEISKYLHLK